MEKIAGEICNLNLTTTTITVVWEWELTGEAIEAEIENFEVRKRGEESRRDIAVETIIREIEMRKSGKI